MAQEAPRDKAKRQTGQRLPLEVGMLVSLSLAGMKDADNNRFNCELVGVVHFEYLILRLPWIPGLRTRLVPGGIATIRLVNAGQLSGFHVEILTHVAKPALLLFLSYPEAVETLSLRQHQRVHCALPVYLHGRRGDGQGLIVDLSQGGCRLVLDVRGKANLRQIITSDEVLLRVVLDAEGHPVSATGTVRNVHQETSRFFLGVSFTDVEVMFTRNLENYIEMSTLLP